MSNKISYHISWALGKSSSQILPRKTDSTMSCGSNPTMNVDYPHKSTLTFLMKEVKK